MSKPTKKNARFISCLFLIFIGCGGAPKTQEVKVAAQPQGSAQERIQASYHGPKIRVAVGEFAEMEAAVSLYQELGWSGIAPSLTDQLTTGLVQTGRVAVLERQQIDKVIGNLSLEKEGDSARYFNQKTTKKTGKLLGAQAILVGAVTSFEPNVSGAEGGLSIAQLGGLTAHTDKAVVGIDVRLVDQESGRVLAAANGKGEIRTTGAGVQASYQGLDIGGQTWSRTPLGQATRAAAENALKILVAGLETIPWENRVVGVSGKRVFIGAGKDLNLQVGDEFVLIKRGAPIKGPDGAVFGYDETEKGRVKITSVQGKMSIAMPMGSASPEKGLLVRLPLN